ncbi:hypothetical protein AgCh_003136 [Apium graveolens]
MQIRQTISLGLLIALVFATAASGHNITRILAKHPEFSTFNHYLTVTHLAADINRRLTITVCAVDNAGMADLLSKHLSVYTMKNVLALHVFADYFGAKKLHQISGGTTLTATMFQATGEADGTSGYVNITDVKGGRVGFAPEDNSGTLGSYFVKSIEEKPYNISVIHISHILSSPSAEAPTAAPSLNVTDVMRLKGCKAFADLLVSEKAEDTFVQSVEGGLTVFCPSDDVLDEFMPKFKNLTAAGKMALLLYHGVPVYNSMGMLRSNNGLMNTLATEGKNKYDFTVQNDGELVKLKTKAVTATVSGTLVDEEPLAVYKINKVLLPRELFKAVKEELAPEPAPAPKASKKKPKTKAKKGETSDDDEEAEAPGPDGSEDDSADDTAADENSSVRISSLGMMAVSSIFGAVMFL